MTHYFPLIRLFGAPNGLCSSITESKHIKAVKEPWRRSNKYNALGQMLLTNQRLDKLAAARVEFTKRGMLKGTCLAEAYAAANGDNRPPDQAQINPPFDDVDVHALPNGEAGVDIEGEDDGEDEDEDEGAVPGPAVEAHVDLARTIRQHPVSPIYNYQSYSLNRANADSTIARRSNSTSQPIETYPTVSL